LAASSKKDVKIPFLTEGDFSFFLNFASILSFDYDFAFSRTMFIAFKRLQAFSDQHYYPKGIIPA